ncbi:MAG: radical SAM protein, partial [Candidatus Bathyarchaeota archaeon]
MSAMKFSFISPSPAPETPGKVEAAWPPLGILYCATLLAENGTEVSVLDQAAQRFTSRETIQWIKRENPDILGFSVLLTSFKEALNLARQAKKHNPDIISVFGNYQATFNADKILENYPFVDVIVRGEGEHTSLELAKCLEKKRNLKDVAGINFRKNGKTVTTPERPLLRNLDALSIPSRSLIDARYSSDIFGIKVASKKFTSIVSSRGCPFGCSFCACTTFAQRLWRPRSVENILNELLFLQSEGYEQFLFVDDNFTLNPKRVVELCQKIRKEKMEIEWWCDSRVDNCTYDMLREMVKAGCKLLYFG